MANKEIQVHKKLVWRVKNLEDWIYDYSDSGADWIDSPDIQIKIGNIETSWALRLHRDENEVTISLSLHLLKSESSSFKTKAIVIVVCKDSAEVEHAEQSGESFKDGVVLTSMKLDNLFKCLDDGKLTIHSNITLLANEVSECEKSATLNKNLQGHFKNMMSDKVFVDFKVETSDGQVLQVHKNVLAFRSPYFFGMLTTKMKEAKDNIVKVPEDAAVMEEVIRFIYCNEVENLNAVAYELVLAAEKYLLDDLKELCIDSIIKSLNSRGVLQALLLADGLTKSEKLKEKCFELVPSNFELLKKSDDWKKLSPNTFTEIISYILKEAENTSHIESSI